MNDATGLGRNDLPLRPEALNSCQEVDGVFVVPGIARAFESLYLQVRSKEGRIYTDEEARRLPDAPEPHPHYEEWKLRALSLRRFKAYLRHLPNNAPRLLDLGAGNGWFCAQLAKEFSTHTYFCLDICLEGLRQ